MRWLADIVYLLAALVYLPVALYQAVVQGKNRRGWAERFGFVPRFDANRRRIWIHAVSLGEINATTRLADALRERFPDFDLVFSSTTDTGFARGVQVYGRQAMFRFPLDFSLVISRVLRRVRPTMIVLVEQEVWFNLTNMATKRGIPVVVINGRLTEKSAKRLSGLGSVVRSLFGRLSWVGSQDDNIASRFRALGVPRERVEVTGSLKWDSASTSDHPDGADSLRCAMGLEGDRPLWVCGSTGPGEEEIILDAYQRLVGRHESIGHPVGEISDPKTTNPPVLAIVPRKPERFGEVARLIERAGFDCVRRSCRRDGGRGNLSPSAVILGDTMGELRKFYSLASVVFVGRTLVPMGGSDPMEVAALGKPIVIGPHTDNFRLPVRAFHDADALRIVTTAEQLAQVVHDILTDDALSEGMATEARRVVVENQGATQRTVDALARVLDGAAKG